MAITDPKYLIKDIIEDYFAANPVTKDDGVAIVSDVHLYERGPEDLYQLFFTDGYDLVLFYGEPRSRSMREIQDVPVHFLMRYPVTVVSIDKDGVTASTIQGKTRDTLRDAVADSAQSAAGATPAYVLTIMEEQGKSQWSGGLNIWSTIYYLEWTTGGP